jgi:hypothetical protein
MSWYSITALLHAGVGTLALITFWVAGLSKKGSAVHKAAGKIYLLTMTGILLTGFPLAVSIVLNKSQVGGMFLLYLLVITATSVWLSWRAIRDKKNVAAYKGRIYRMLMVLNGLSGLAMVYVGLVMAEHTKLIISAFSLIGLISAWRMAKFIRKQDYETKWWMREHINSMLGNGVATHIAFLSIGFPKLLPMLSGPMQQNIAWLGPLVVAGVAGIFLSKKYLSVRNVTTQASMQAEKTTAQS